VDDEDQLAAAGEVAASVAGISRVQNDLRAHSRIRARNA
jgi:osmotically-inducible protein OsmY